MLDDALDTLDSLLGDEEAAAKTKSETPPKFVKRDSLAPDQQSGAAAQEILNSFDQMPIEFVHFGSVHPDDGSHFDHAETDDLLGEADLDADRDLRALQYRAALERETLLLHGFADSTQRVISEYTASQGPLGDITGAAMDLVTGSDAAEDSPPDAAELDLHKEDIANTGGTVNLPVITWGDTFTAGRDLHLQRADYRQFATNAITYWIEKKGGGGDGGLSGLLPDMPGVTDAIKTVQSIVFKAHDISLALFLRCRDKYEPIIEAKCYEASVAAIRENRRQVYDIWFPQPPVTASNQTQNGSGPDNVVEEAIADVEEKIDEAKQAVDDAVSDVQDFLGFEDDPPEAWGSDSLAAIFSAIGVSGTAAEDAHSSATGSAPPDSGPEIGRLFVAAFEEVIEVEVPGFVRDLILEVTAVNLRLLDRVYRAILLGRGRVKIDAETMIRLGREEIADTIVSLAGRFIPGLGMLNDPNADLIGVGGLGQFGGEEISNIATRYLDSGLGKQLGKIIDLTSSELAADLEAARTSAGDDAITMELFLAQLPRIATQQFRNTFFPLVDLVIDKVFGALSGPLSGAWNPVKGFVDGMKNKAKGVYDDAMDVHDDVMDAKEKAEQVQQKLADGVDLIDAAKDPEGFVDDLLADDPLTGGPADDPPPPPFPGSDRARKGMGQWITHDDADVVDEARTEMVIVVE